MGSPGTLETSRGNQSHSEDGHEAVGDSEAIGWTVPEDSLAASGLAALIQAEREAALAIPLTAELDRDRVGSAVLGAE